MGRTALAGANEFGERAVGLNGARKRAEFEEKRPRKKIPCENWVVPPGLASFSPLYPPLKRWAKLDRPSGARLTDALHRRINQKQDYTHTLKPLCISRHLRSLIDKISAGSEGQRFHGDECIHGGGYSHEFCADCKAIPGYELRGTDRKKPISMTQPHMTQEKRSKAK